MMTECSYIIKTGRFTSLLANIIHTVRYTILCHLSQYTTCSIQSYSTSTYSVYARGVCHKINGIPVQPSCLHSFLESALDIGHLSTIHISNGVKNVKLSRLKFQKQFTLLVRLKFKFIHRNNGHIVTNGKKKVRRRHLKFKCQGGVNYNLLKKINLGRFYN